jgi:hypothetical protein
LAEPTSVGGCLQPIIGAGSTMWLPDKMQQAAPLCRIQYIKGKLSAVILDSACHWVEFLARFNFNRCFLPLAYFQIEMSIRWLKWIKIFEKTVIY